MNWNSYLWVHKKNLVAGTEYTICLFGPGVPYWAPHLSLTPLQVTGFITGNLRDFRKIPYISLTWQYKVRRANIVGGGDNPHFTPANKLKMEFWCYCWHHNSESLFPETRSLSFYFPFLVQLAKQNLYKSAATETFCSLKIQSTTLV